MSALFRVKICGVTRVEDARVAVDAGADAIGLNFYPASRRYVSPQRATILANELSEKVQLVGVFVNEIITTVRQTSEDLSLDFVQLHGDEPLDYLRELDDQRVIKAFRIGESGLDNVADYLRDCRGAARLPDGVLIDGHVPGEYGGTGKTANWQLLAEQRSRFLGIPLILAGGLHPQNVMAAVDCVRPDAVDTASGVEHEPGIKDPRLTQDFVRAARQAFAGV